MYEILAVLAAFAFVYSVVASRVERTPVNGAVVFLAFGILAGPQVLGLLDLNVDGEGLRTVAEFTLALVLFVCRQSFWDHKGVFRREGSGSSLRLGRVA